MSQHASDEKKPKGMPVLTITNKDAAAFEDVEAEGAALKEHKAALVDIKARAAKLGPFVTVQTDTGRLVTTLRS